MDGKPSGIHYVNPVQRHTGEDCAILAARDALYIQAREHNAARWSRLMHDWTTISAVTLNPEFDAVVAMTSHAADIQPLAA